MLNLDIFRILIIITFTRVPINYFDETFNQDPNERFNYWQIIYL